VRVDPIIKVYSNRIQPNGHENLLESGVVRLSTENEKWFCIVLIVRRLHRRHFCSRTQVNHAEIPNFLKWEVEFSSSTASGYSPYANTSSQRFIVDGAINLIPRLRYGVKASLYMVHVHIALEIIRARVF
jgi:hypothetical protein